MTYGITERQADVLTGILRGLSNAQIAAEFQIGESCIKHHVANLMRHFGVESRLALVIKVSRPPKPTARMLRLAA